MNDKITFTLLYDKAALPNFNSGWGLALLINFMGHTILFDTGWNGEILLSNMAKLDLDIHHITDIFLSHQHWDHVGGIVFLLNRKLKMLQNIFVPESFSKRFKEELGTMSTIVEIPMSKKPIKLFPGVWSTGVLMGSKIHEHSLILKYNNKLFLITGCAHPLLDNIMSQASKIGVIQGIIGGFHDFSNLEALNGIEKIVPIHCTKKKDEIRQMFENESIELKVGASISFDLNFSLKEI